MKVAIAGAGITGAYLYRRLQARCAVDIFDLKQSTRCGLAPCAWATTKGFETYVTRCGLEPGRYIRDRADTVLLGNASVKVDLRTFDKPQFVKDLLKGAKINYALLVPQRYDRVIDATGLWRAFLPPLADDIQIPCTQFLVQAKKPLENRISFERIGYAWCFALTDGRYHVGCGSLTESPRVTLDRLGWLSSTEELKILCSCSGAVRIASVHHAQPFVISAGAGEVWGVGEAIGCVSPLVGEGIIPGLESAEILLDHWDDAEGYTKAILSQFAWMKNERAVIDRLRSGKRLGIRDAWIIKKNSRRMGVRAGLNLAMTLIKRLRYALM